MPDLPDRPLLADYQAYVIKLETERGFASQTVVEKCLLMGEEVGELFKAIRKTEGIAIDPTAQVAPVADELADVFIFLCSIANRYGIDLADAFLAKERLNKTRSWVSGKKPGI